MLCTGHVHAAGAWWETQGGVAPGPAVVPLTGGESLVARVGGDLGVGWLLGMLLLIHVMEERERRLPGLRHSAAHLHLVPCAMWTVERGPFGVNPHT